jgi:hypothetical protein
MVCCTSPTCVGNASAIRLRWFPSIEEIEVKVLQIDREKQKIALGLKQKQQQPMDQHRREVSGRYNSSMGKW